MMSLAYCHRFSFCLQDSQRRNGADHETKYIDTGFPDHTGDEQANITPKVWQRFFNKKYSGKHYLTISFRQRCDFHIFNYFWQSVLQHINRPFSSFAYYLYSVVHTTVDSLCTLIHYILYYYITIPYILLYYTFTICLYLYIYLHYISSNIAKHAQWLTPFPPT